MNTYKILLPFIFISTISIFGQDISLYQKFNGRIDFTMFGNTLNIEENEDSSNCEIYTSSSAALNLAPENQIEAAYLYWSGSGIGDNQILLNNQVIIAERTFSDLLVFNTYNFFSCFADVTSIIQNQGNTNYTVSDLDLTNIITSFCNIGLNFGGWAIVVIYKNDNLPQNQINVYDGLEHVYSQIPELTIQIDNLYVADNTDSKIGFLAWEGDSALAVNETLTVNGNTVSNTINPIDNVFNGTNSFTGQTNLYNMDLDFYDISNYVSVGDTSVEVKLTSGQDFVMVNTIVTKFNVILPDAFIELDSITILYCDSRTIQVNFKIYNLDSSDILPANTPIAIYADTLLLGVFYTQNPINIDNFESFELEITIPNYVSDIFELHISADDTGTGVGIILELNETNNQVSQIINIKYFENSLDLENLKSCNTGNYIGLFNLEEIISQLDITLYNEVSFFNTEEDANLEQNQILNPTEYYNQNNFETIYIRIQDSNSGCYTITSFQLEIENCLPRIPQGFSPNSDGINDTFYIQNLQNVYVNFEIYYYNRYGNLVFKGDNSSYEWNGEYNKKPAPAGTYFYVLYLNDLQKITYKGWFYLNR